MIVLAIALVAILSTVVSRRMLALHRREHEAILARDDLINSLSHELRTPLTSVLGHLDLALETHAEANIREHLIIAQRSGERLLALLERMLRATSTPEPLQMEPVEIIELIDQVVAEQRPVAQERAIELVVRAEAAEPVWGDQPGLLQVLSNLLSNAIKYNRDGGRVVIESRGQDEWHLVRISDTGSGIDMAHSEQLFERYVRSESVRHSSIHGQGLGLAVSREILRVHGGDLVFEASSPEGSVLRLSLPVAGSAS